MPDKHFESRGSSSLFGSLRSRYLIIAALFALLVVGSTTIVHLYVAHTSRISANNIEGRNQTLQLSRQIKDSLWKAENALHSYMLAPIPSYQEIWHKEMEAIKEHVHKLSQRKPAEQQEWPQELDELSTRLTQLQHEGQSLMYIRTDIELLFPSLRIMTNTLFPNHQAFTTAAELAAEEFRNSSNVLPEDYWTLEDARHLWTKMIYTFRGYILYQVGMFGNSGNGLEAQHAAIERLHQAVMAHVARLQERNRAGALSLQASASVQDMQQAAEAWYAGYQKIQQIHASEAWRLDTPYLEKNIQPLFDHIWDTLLTLDQRIEEAAAKDVTQLTAVAGDIAQTLWILTLLGLASSVVGFVYFRRLVLWPIESITQALQAVAKGESHVELPQGSTRETATLIEAFAEMRRQVEHRQIALQHQALHDALTGLPNRTLIQDRLHQAILAAQRHDESVALLMMDLNRFKEINDTLGHHVGDRVLQLVAERLSQLLRESDTVARLGGDEFAILLPLTDEQHAKHVAQKIQSALEQVFQVDGRNLYIGGSIGIALFPQHGPDGATLIKRADVAMYLAKRSNSGCAVYDFEQDRHSVGRLELVSELRKAIKENTLDLHYQPKLSLATGSIVGVEALLRWNHPQRGFVPPDALITIAEETGLIHPLTLWALDAALRQCAAWRHAGIELNVAVNLSVWNLQDPELYRQIADCLDSWNVPPSRLELEITESAMMADPARALDTLLRLDALGVRLAVDDYGTGFSSLAYLKSLPLDELKIDKSFILDMLQDENDTVIVQSTINLAHNLGLRVVAEGVEDSDTCDLLRDLGCDVVQGYYIGRPMPAAGLERWMENWSGNSGPQTDAADRKDTPLPAGRAAQAL